MLNSYFMVVLTHSVIYCLGSNYLKLISGKCKLLKINCLHLKVKIRSFIMLTGMAGELKFHALVEPYAIT